MEEITMEMYAKFLATVVARYMLLNETYSIKIPADELISLIKNGNTIEVDTDSSNDYVILRVIKK